MLLAYLVGPYKILQQQEMIVSGSDVGLVESTLSESKSESTWFESESESESKHLDQTECQQESRAIAKMTA